MKMTGNKEHEERLTALAGETLRSEIVKRLYAAGQLVEIEAEHSITDGSISGKGHVRSLPGSPPKADTRLLDTSIETTIEDTESPRVRVTSNAPYSGYLEYGTATMAERPYMRPALAKMKEAILDLVKHAVTTISRKRS